jgi:transcriptional regulator with XRE-family HTH domain
LSVPDAHAAALLSSFGKALRKDRRAAECPQDELARRAELTSKTVRLLEHGQIDARLSTLCKVAKGLGGDLFEMLQRFPPDPAVPG